MESHCRVDAQPHCLVAGMLDSTQPYYRLGICQAITAVATTRPIRLFNRSTVI